MNPARAHPADPHAPPRVRERILDVLLATWRRVLSPVFAASGLGHCRYLPTCSEYAYVAVARHGWLRGPLLALGRLSRCHPWAAGGLDPVPPHGPFAGTQSEEAAATSPAARAARLNASSGDRLP